MFIMPHCDNNVFIVSLWKDQFTFIMPICIDLFCRFSTYFWAIVFVIDLYKSDFAVGRWFIRFVFTSLRYSRLCDGKAFQSALKLDAAISTAARKIAPSNNALLFYFRSWWINLLTKCSVGGGKFLAEYSACQLKGFQWKCLCLRALW